MDTLDLGECVETDESVLVSAGESLTSADCADLGDALEQAVSGGALWWELGDGTFLDTLTAQTPIYADGLCLIQVEP